MPMLQINTNVKKADIKAGFMEEVATTFQKAVGKPMEVVAVQINPDQMMSFGGTTDPCAVVLLNSAGKISPEENLTYSKAIAGLMAKLGVKSDRLHTVFADIAMDNWSYQGTTLSVLFAPKK